MLISWKFEILNKFEEIIKDHIMKTYYLFLLLVLLGYSA